MQFSTMNESHLHKTLKLLYSEESGGQCEVEKNGFVYDIFSEEKGIIEIQTKNLAKLLPKIMDALERNIKIKLVHPIPIETRILLKDSSGRQISNRKSPKKESIYSIFRELTGLYPILLNPKFTLEVLEVRMTEERIRTEEAVQSKNKRRRFRKNWLKTGKRLEEILESHQFKSKDDYLKLLPQSLPNDFSAKILSEELINNKLVQKSKALNIAYLIVWVFTKMGLIEIKGKKNKSRIYSLTS
ncbi:MAG: hypothetical protein K5829_12585 [Treponema sp.]|nr:hypothetical protein [Treponema sp.]